MITNKACTVGEDVKMLFPPEMMAYRYAANPYLPVGKERWKWY